MASKKQSKSLPKSNIQLPTSQAQDMFQTLLDSPIYSSPSGSSSNPQHSMGFAQYASSQPPQFNPYPYPLPPHFHNAPYYPSFGTPIPTPIQTPESDTEEVEETQPIPETQPNRKGKKVICKKVPWTDLESKILAERWVHVSENPATGNSQSKDSFWGEIRRQYNSLVDEQRRADQITGKWSKMSRDVKQFIAIYSKLEEHWQSGAGGEDIMLHARKMFKQQTKRIFSYEEAWRVLKDCPKFLAPEGVMTNKRSRPDDPFQQEPIDVNDDDNPNPAHFPDPKQFEALFRDDPIRRPPGRSKSQKSSTSSDAASRLSKEEAREKLVITTEAAAEATTRTMEKLAEDSEMRTMFKGLKLLSKPVSRDLPPDEYRMIMKAREKIKKKYAKHFEDSDEDEE